MSGKCGKIKMEIGSEFWLDSTHLKKNEEIPSWLNIDFYEQRMTFFSGRTAIYAILDSMSETYLFEKSVYMPSYCCDSMLQPFIDSGFKIFFYKIEYDYANGCFRTTIDNRQRCGIFYVMSYFGFSLDFADSIDFYKREGTIIIQDATHSFFSRGGIELRADYVFVSLRKWMPLVSGAVVYSHKIIDRPNRKNPNYLSCRYKAMLQKGEYMLDKTFEKQQYLDLYSKFNKMIRKDYIGYPMDSISVSLLNTFDISSMIEIRRKNYQRLERGLNDWNVGRPIFGKLEDGVVPFCFTILIEKRDQLRTWLTMNNIYCPIHWAVELFPNDRDDIIYNSELSIPCDQRYSSDHMDKILLMLKQYK